MLDEEIHDAFRDRRRPIDNVLDAMSVCYEIVEETNSDGKALGVFKTKFDREKARYILEEYVDQKSLGRMG